MNEFGLPVVTPDRCTACDDCVEVCPKDLFVLMPIDHKLIVQCKSAVEGDEAEEICRVACTACGKCAQDQTEGVIDIVDGLARVNYARIDEATPAATQRCPTGAIAWVEGGQFAETLGPARTPEAVRSEVR
jgi:ferredoxin